MSRRHVVTGGFAFVVAAVVFWFANNISRDARAGFARAGWWGAVSTSTDSVSGLRLGVSWAPVDVAVGLGVVAVGGLALWVARLSRGRLRQGVEHGSARWGRASDIRGIMNVRVRERNLWLTATEGISLDRPERPEWHRNLNVLCLGASGSGKSRNFIVPNVTGGQSSFMVTDPKGEILRMTGRSLVEAGFKIRVLNLVDMDGSDQFNAMAYLRPGHEPEDVGLLVRNIMANTDGEKKMAGGGDPFWEKAEAALLNALVAFVAATFDPAERHLGSVVELLGQMQAVEDGDASMVDRLFEQANPGMGASRQETELLQFAAANYRIYRQAASKTAASIIVSAGVRLAPLLIPSVRRLVSADSLDLDRVGFEKTALFLVISDTNRQFNWLASLVFTMFFQRAVFLADRQVDGRLPVPVQCAMDEFANIGRVPDFDVLAATIRSRGISFQAVLQNIGQGKAVYGDRWRAIIGNCDSVLFLGSADAETRKFISEALGRETIHSWNTSSSSGRGGSSSRSRQTLGRELMSPDEVGRLPGDEAILLVRGLPPFRSKKLAPVPAREPYRHRVAVESEGWR